MATICNKCRYLWQRLGKNYCLLGAHGANCQFKKGKKQCDYFDEGLNIKKYLGKSNGWWKKK